MELTNIVFDIDLIAKSLKNYFERKNGKENLSLS